MFDNASFNFRKGSKSQQRRARALNIEALENRELLSVSPLASDISDAVPALVAPLAASNAEIDNAVLVDITGVEMDVSPTSPVALEAASYNVNETAQLQTFLELTDANGVKNGTKINSSGYNVNDPSTWTGVTWKEVDGVNRVSEINWIRKNLVGALNLSAFTALNQLYCYSNQLTALDVSECTSLTQVYCNSNQLTSLNISGCTAMTYMQSGYNQLTALDVSECTALSTLSCGNTPLTSLNLSNNTALTTLHCNSCQLTELDVSNNTALKTLNFESNQLNELEVSNNTALTSLYCQSNQLTELDVSECTMLTTLNCASNQLTELDVSNNTALTSLSCGSNQLTSLDISNNAALTSLSCGSNQLTSLDISKNTALTSLSCGSNQLTSLDISKNTALKTLNCESNQLTELGVSNNTALETLWCYSNQLTSLDVSNNTALTSLECSSNSLMSLDVSKNSALTSLSCQSNQLTSLDLSNNTALKSLNCQSNQLTSLDISNKTALTYLECTRNQLTELNVSGCTALTIFQCSYNQLTSLDVSDCTALPKLDCWNTTLNYVKLPSERTIDIKLQLGGVQSTVNDAYGNTVGTNVLTYTLSPTATLPIYASNSYNPLVAFTDIDLLPLDVPSLNVNVSGINNVSVIVGSVENASRYLLQYSYNADFNNKTTLNIEPGNLTVNELSSGRVYYFRTKALGTGLYSNSIYSEPVRIFTGFNNQEASRLFDFLELTDSNGEKNGTKINSNYSPDYPSTWTGVTWTLIDGVRYVSAIDWSNKGLVGVLDLSEFASIVTLDVSGNQLTELDVSGCTDLTNLDCSNNELTKLDLSDCTSLTNLDCSDNNLTDLTVSGCTDLTNLNCSNNDLTELDLSDCTNLTDLNCSGNDLTSIDVSGCDNLVNVDIDNIFPLETPTLTASATGNDSISVTVDGVLYAYGYTLEYSTSSDFTNATSLEVEAGDTNISELEANTTYYFRVQATSSNNDVYSDSDYSNTVSATTDTIQLTAPTLNPAVVQMANVSFSWEAIPNASGYLFEYKAVGAENWTEGAVEGTAASFIGDLGAEYTARVKALGEGSYSDSAYSAELGSSQIVTAVTINNNKVTVSWVDDSPAADAVRYRVAGATKWTTKKLKAGVTTFTFSGKAGTDYDIEVLLDQQENNALQASAIVLDQPKLASIKNELKDDSFQVNVTNYAAKNLAANVKQAIVSVNGVMTTMNIVDQQGETALANGGKVAFNNGLFTFSEMNSNTSYKVQISFSDGRSVSKTSSALTVKTLKAPYLPPVIVSANAVSDTAITVTWETAYGKNTTTPAQKYTVQYSTDGNKWTNATTGATGNEYTIQRLKGGVEYQVRVLATKGSAFEASAPSEVLNTATLALPKTVLDKNSVKDDTFKLDVTNYANSNLVNAPTLNVKSDKFGETAIAIQNGSGSATFENGMIATFENGALTFTNAPFNTQQKIQVNFSNGVCTTAWTKALTVKTTKAPFNTPVLTNAEAVSSTSVLVEWEPAYGKNSTVEAPSYTVQYTTDGTRWTNANAKVVGTSYTIPNLKPNTSYRVAVIANKDAQFNASLPSESLEVRTL